MLSQMIIGFMLESVMGPLRVAILYLAAGVGGNIFSSLCNYGGRSVGASTAIFGLLSGLLALVLVNWKALDRSPEVRCCLIVMVIFIVLFSVLMAFSNSGNTVDTYGHLGGFISGFFVGIVVMVRFRGQEAAARGSYEKKVQIVGVIMTFIFYVLLTTLFFTVMPAC